MAMKLLFGVRDPEKEEKDPTANTKIASVAEAAKSSGVLVLAVPSNAVPAAIKSAGDLTGKIILDATNPLLPDLSGLGHEAWNIRL